MFIQWPFMVNPKLHSKHAIVTLWIINYCHSYIDDDSHVILKPLPGHDDCQHDYINTSYVDVSTSSLYKHRYCGMFIFQNHHFCRVTPFPVNSLPHKVSKVSNDAICQDILRISVLFHFYIRDKSSRTYTYLRAGHVCTPSTATYLHITVFSVGLKWTPII